MKIPQVSRSCLGDRSRRIKRGATPSAAKQPSESPTDQGHTPLSAVILSMLRLLTSNFSKPLDFSSEASATTPSRHHLKESKICGEWALASAILLISCQLMALLPPQTQRHSHIFS